MFKHHSTQIAFSRKDKESSEIKGQLSEKDYFTARLSRTLAGLVDSLAFD
jgi:hypothetical protein